jgi:hypothetical protein
MSKEHDAIIDHNTDYLFLQNKLFHYLDLLSSITLYPNNKSNYRLTILDSNNNEISWNVEIVINIFLTMNIH